MLRLSRHIEIGEYTIDGVVEMEIVSSWDMLTDTCRMTFPRKINWQDKAIAFGEGRILKRGDSVDISLGYNDENTLSFSGFVTNISSKIPTEIKAEDHAWLLKQKTHTVSFKDATLKEVLHTVLDDDVEVVAPELRLGPFRLSNVTAAQVLEYLRKNYFQKAFFRNGKLYVGFAYQASLQASHRIRFDVNVVENNLDYMVEDDIKINLKVINILPDNSRKEYAFGDPNGEQRTLHYYDKSEDDIKRIGEEEITRMRFTGYRGSLTIFGQPHVEHGDEVELLDPYYPERDGKYLVKKVTRQFGNNGYRQILELDLKV